MIWLRQLGQDAGFALRMLPRIPSFTGTVIVTLAVGIGMTSAVLGVIADLKDTKLDEVVAATFLTRVIASLLYDVRPTDLQTFAIAAVGLTLAAFAASLVPALRAARIDPAETLR